MDQHHTHAPRVMTSVSGQQRTELERSDLALSRPKYASAHYKHILCIYMIKISTISTLKRQNSGIYIYIYTMFSVYHAVTVANINSQCKLCSHCVLYSQCKPCSHCMIQPQPSIQPLFPAQPRMIARTTTIATSAIACG